MTGLNNRIAKLEYTRDQHGALDELIRLTLGVVDADGPAERASGSGLSAHETLLLRVHEKLRAIRANEQPEVATGSSAAFHVELSAPHVPPASPPLETNRPVDREAGGASEDRGSLGGGTPPPSIMIM